MNKNIKRNLWKDNRVYFLAVLAVLSFVMIVQLLILQVLPLKYNLCIIALLILLWLLMLLLQYNKHINKFNRTLGKVIITVLCLLLGAGNFYVYKAADTLRSISGSNLKTDAISVIVKADSEAKEIDDLQNKTIGILKLVDRDNTDKALQDVEKKLESVPSAEEFDNAFDMASALYEGSVDAIMLNEAYRGTFQDSEENTLFKNFDTETKVIYQVEIESEIQDISKNVDVTKTPFSIFISGIDTYGPVSTSSRSDVNMLATINPVTHQIVLTSIPRDYYVAQTCQGGQRDKLTHAGIFGVECSVSTIEGLFDVDINYYARVNFSSLIQIVNALGGITIDNPNAFYTGTYSYAAGTISLNGEEALEFSRDRAHQEGGDRGRGKNQMRVITGIINKALSPSIITNYSSVMNAVSGSFQTNMDSNEITAIIQKQLDSMSGWDIVQSSVDGTGGTDWTPANGFNAYVMYPDESSVNQAKILIHQVLNGETVNQK